MLSDELTLTHVYRLKSRAFIWNEIPKLTLFNITDKWRERWSDASVCNYDVIDDPTEKPGGFQLPRTAWSRLNRTRTGHACCGSCLFKWGLRDSPQSGCGVGDQTMRHIVCN